MKQQVSSCTELTTLLRRLAPWAFTPRTALCIIAFQEERYLDEWLRYHLYLGFDHIFIYDNAREALLEEFAIKYPGFVTVIHFPGKNRQSDAYDHFAKISRGSFEWGACIDGDEFIVLKKHESIGALLAEHCRHGALAINWVLFGSNGHLHYSPEPVLQRFTRRERGVSPRVKTIGRLSDVRKWVHPHYPALKRGTMHDADGRIIEATSRNPQGNDRIAQINHYRIKSSEEFAEKMNRGAVDTKVNTPDEFSRDDKNEIEETRAWDFFCQQPPFEKWLAAHKPYQFKLRPAEKIPSRWRDAERFIRHWRKSFFNERKSSQRSKIPQGTVD
jgi:hypothetical protein